MDLWDLIAIVPSLGVADFLIFGGEWVAHAPAEAARRRRLERARSRTAVGWGALTLGVWALSEGVLGGVSPPHPLSLVLAGAASAAAGVGAAWVRPLRRPSESP
ncbi:MAG: hypothetical protein K6V73_04210 [Firmicutes bacterium]|nr:hypothetical protein [Bacillota bacterium]